MKIRYYIIAFIALFMCNTAVFAQERNPNRMVFHKGDKILKTYSVGEIYPKKCFGELYGEHRI